MKFAYKPETVKTKHQIAGFKAKFLRYNTKSKSIQTTAITVQISETKPIYCPQSLNPKQSKRIPIIFRFEAKPGFQLKSQCERERDRCDFAVRDRERDRRIRSTLMEVFVL